jgi:regulatory protein
LIDAGSTSSAPQRTEAQDEALQRALRYLGYRPRSEAEVRSHLRQRGYAAAAIEHSVQRLRQLNYLNDSNFARSWAASKVTGSGYGPKRIEQELRAKGILPELIREVISDIFGADEETRNAKCLLERRYKKSDLDDPKQQRRAVAFLLRRGYSSKVIYNILKYSVEEP